MRNFQDLFPAIIETFSEMSLNTNYEFNNETVSKASSHLNGVERFDFIVAMVITRHVFDLTMDVKKLI